MGESSGIIHKSLAALVLLQAGRTLDGINTASDLDEPDVINEVDVAIGGNTDIPGHIDELP